MRMETKPLCYEDIRLSPSDSKWQKREMIWIVKWSSQTTKPIHKLQAWQLNSTNLDRRPQKYPQLWHSRVELFLQKWYAWPAVEGMEQVCQWRSLHLGAVAAKNDAQPWTQLVIPVSPWLSQPRAQCLCGKSMEEIAGSTSYSCLRNTAANWCKIVQSLAIGWKRKSEDREDEIFVNLMKQLILNS